MEGSEESPDELIGKLRQSLDDQYAAGCRAIDAMAASFRRLNALAAALSAVSSTTVGSADIKGNPGQLLHNLDYAGYGKVGADTTERSTQTNVGKVLAAIADAPKTALTIAIETGLTEAQVRGVLYSKPIQPKITARKLPKKLTTYIVDNWAAF